MPAEFGGGGPVVIVVSNEAKTPLGVDLGQMVQAIQTQISRDFATRWGGDATLMIGAPGQQPEPGQWQLVLLDDADQADALGYHEVTEDNEPIGKVFVKTTVDDGQLVSVTTSHEILEMLADPGIQMAAADEHGVWYAYECCDPVQASTYEIDGIPVSSFVFPAWFESFRKGQSGLVIDHLGELDQPFQLASGGYISISKRRNHWEQLFGSIEAASQFNARAKHRVKAREVKARG